MPSMQAKTKSDPVNVLFVCLGNICRSPTAEGVFRDLVKREGLSERIRTDSAGTHPFHVGEQPDGRAQQHARKRGVELSDLRARAVRRTDFEKFDYILAMDGENFMDLKAMRPSGQDERVYMFLEFAPELGKQEVPDPYYGGAQGFEHVLDLVEAAARGLLADIKENHL